MRGGLGWAFTRLEERGRGGWGKEREGELGDEREKRIGKKGREENARGRGG